MKKKSGSAHAKKSGSPDRFPSLTAKVLRKFDKVHKNFKGKDFTERYMKSKVEKFLDKMEKDEQDEQLKKRL